MGVNKYLIMASHNIKILKIYFNCNTLIWSTLFLLGLCSIVMSVLRLSLRVRVLHGPKNDQSLCNTVMVVSRLNIGFMKYVLSYPKGIA